MGITIPCKFQIWYPTRGTQFVNIIKISNVKPQKPI